MAAAALEEARGLLARKQDDQAVSDLRRLINTYSKTPAALDAHLLIAQVYERQNRLEEAMAIYREAREANPSDDRVAEVLLREARVMMRSRRSDRNQAARRLLAESSDRFPAASATAQALAIKAQIEERDRLRDQDPILGSVPAALLTYRLIAERYPNASEMALLKLKDYYEDLRRYDLAAQTLVELFTRYPTKHDDALFEAGEIYERRLKDREKAIEIYARVPASSDRYRRAQDRLKELGKQ
jgi:TolA-binding protein